jgi:hypothetical protein
MLVFYFQFEENDDPQHYKNKQENYCGDCKKVEA